MSATPKTAMILAAGLGTRMRPLTDDRPKPLIEVAGRTLLDHILDRLEAAGIGDVVVNVHYLPQMIRDHLARRSTPSTHVSDETARLLDSGGGILKAMPVLGDTPFFTINGDSLWSEEGVPELERMAQAWDGDAMDGLMLVVPMDRCSGFEGRGDFFLDGDCRLSRRGDAPRAPYAWTGVQLVHPRLYDNPPGTVFSSNTMWDRAMARGRLFGVIMNGFWMHVGTPDARDEAERRILSQDFSMPSVPRAAP